MARYKIESNGNYREEISSVFGTTWQYYSNRSEVFEADSDEKALEIFNKTISNRFGDNVKWSLIKINFEELASKTGKEIKEEKLALEKAKQEKEQYNLYLKLKDKFESYVPESLV